MSSPRERTYVNETLWPELQMMWDNWAAEYEHQERDLGIRGEFVGLYRKVRKIKSIVWDRVDASNWREGLRIMLFEVIAHALLMLVDLDKESNEEALDAIVDAQEDREQEHKLPGDEDDEKEEGTVWEQ